MGKGVSLLQAGPTGVLESHPPHSLLPSPLMMMMLMVTVARLPLLLMLLTMVEQLLLMT